MAARAPHINLLHKTSGGESSTDKIIFWALTVGRWIVIVTELIVISAFVWRFSLDYQIDDLKGDIESKKNYIQSLEQAEKKFRLVQKRLDLVGGAVKQQPDLPALFKEFSKSVPNDLVIVSFNVNGDAVNVVGTSIDETQISILENKLKSSPIAKNVKLVSVELIAKDENNTLNPLHKYKFSLTAQVNLFNT